MEKVKKEVKIVSALIVVVASWIIGYSLDLFNIMAEPALYWMLGMTAGFIGGILLSSSKLFDTKDEDE